MQRSRDPPLHLDQELSSLTPAWVRVLMALDLAKGFQIYPHHWDRRVARALQTTEYL